jgi:photosystem II stability/assembly factor-like uncharacterized protein
VALAVVAVIALAALHHGGRSRAAGEPAAPSTPRGGMRGVVTPYGFALPGGSGGIVSFQQCQPCHAAPRGGAQRFADWLATSVGPERWTVRRTRFLVSEPQFSGVNGWAQGEDDARGAGRLAAFYVTHDAGRTWQVAPTPSPSPGLGSVSVAGGEVWSFGEACTGACTVTVLHAPVTAGRLTAVAAQPVHGDDLNLQVMAAAHGTAYVLDPKTGGTFVTRDDGRSWTSVTPPPCPRRGGSAVFQGAGSGWLWALCPGPGPQLSLQRSVDGARSWQPARLPTKGVRALAPSSSQVAWLLDSHRRLLRTSDGGRDWTPVLEVTAIEPHLVQQDARHAAVLAMVVRGHFQRHARYTNLVVYRTADGGRSWRRSVVGLPAG